MGSVTFDYLTESILFDDDLMRSEYRGVDDARLEKELEGYRGVLCVKNAGN